MTWYARIEGEQFDLESLMQLLQSETYAIEKLDDGFYLSSVNFEGLDDSSKVKEHAIESIARINGVAKLEWGYHRPIRFADFLLRIENSGYRSVIALPPTIVIRTTTRILTNVSIALESDEVSRTDRNEMNSRLILAESNPDVAKVLRLIGTHPTSWDDLNRAIEVIANSVGSTRKLKQLKWADERDIDAFKHTVNHPGAIGDKARHGYSPHDPPKKPMSPETADDLLRRLAFEWLNWLEGKIA